MRSLLLGALAVAGTALAAAPAVACPSGSWCVEIAQDLGRRNEVAATPRDPQTLPSMQLALLTYTHTGQAQGTDADGDRVSAGASAAAYSLTMDAVFCSLKNGVNARLPKVHAAGLELMLSPVIVQTAFVKIPGLGFSSSY